MQFRDHSLSFLGNSSSWPFISLVHYYPIFLVDHFSNYVHGPSNILASYFLELQQSVSHSSWAPLVIIAQDPVITNHCRCSRELIWSKQLSDLCPPTFTVLPPKTSPTYWVCPSPDHPTVPHILTSLLTQRTFHESSSQSLPCKYPYSFFFPGKMKSWLNPAFHIFCACTWEVKQKLYW